MRISDDRESFVRRGFCGTRLYGSHQSHDPPTKYMMIYGTPVFIYASVHSLCHKPSGLFFVPMTLISFRRCLRLLQALLVTIVALVTDFRHSLNQPVLVTK